MDIVGKNVERLDARAKATGAAKFTVDIREVGMLTAKFLRSPYSFAQIVSVDNSEAENCLVFMVLLINWIWSEGQHIMTYSMTKSDFLARLSLE